MVNSVDMRSATAHRKECNLMRIFHIFVLKNIDITRLRVALFSCVKSGKFSSGENKLTFHSINIMAWAVAYLAQRFTRAFITNNAYGPRFFLCRNQS